MENYQQYLANATGATSKFSAALKTIGTNIAIMLAVNLVIKGLTAAWDAMNVTVAESQENLDSINSKISELKSEIEELNSVQFKTDQQELRLNNLEKELELQEKLLEIEKKKYYQELTGNSFTDYFDSNNLNTIYEKEKVNANNVTDYSEYSQAKYDYANTKKLLDELDKDISSTTNEKKLVKLTKERAKLLEQQVNVASILADKELEYYGYYKQAQEVIDSGTLSGDDLKDAEEIAQKWKFAYEEAKAYSTNIQKDLGTYSYADEIEGILAKADFDGIKDKLMSLGEAGTLSISVLNSKFPELIEYLKEAGIDAQILLGYIMQFSNPDATNYVESKLELLDVTGIGRNNPYATETSAYKKLQETGMFEANALEAFVKIKADGIDTSEWDIEDWIYNIQNKINENPIELNVEEPISISSTIDQLNTQLKPAFDSLKSAYQNIFETDDKGKEIFSLDNVDLSVLEKIKSSIKEIGEAGVTIEESVYDDLVNVLTNSSSSADDVHKAFNDFATSVLYCTDVTENLNESTANLVEQMLESMGVINAHEVVTQALAANERELEAEEIALANASKDLTSITGAEIVSMKNEGIVVEEVAQDMALFALQKQAANLTTISTADDISNLSALVFALSATGLQCIKLNELINLLNGNTIMPEERKQNIINSIQTEIQNIMNGKGVEVDIPVGFNGGDGKDASKSAKKSADAWKEAYEKELAELEHLHEMGLISDEEYYNQRIALNEKYFGEASGKHEKYLDDYRKNEEEIANGLKKLWQDYWDDYKENLDKTISYAEKLFQKEIDALNKQKDDSDDGYDKEIESIESVIEALEDKRDKEKEYWQDQIDAIQDEIDALQDANDERERALNLQQKMYNLQRAMSQRSILQYSSDKGMHYVSNDEDIRNARNEVEQAKLDITIANLQKQKDALEDKLDDITDKYEVQIEKLNYRKETIEKNMDAENKKIQEQIDLLEKQKSKWTEISDNIEFALLEQDIKAKYGDDVTEKILGDNVQFLNDFISDYERTTGIINSLNEANLTNIMEMVNQFGTSAENLGGIAGQIEDSVSKVSDASNGVDTSNLNTNLTNTGDSSAIASEKIHGVAQAFNDLSTEISNYEIPSLNTDNLISTFGENGTVLSELNSFVNRFKEICASIPTVWNDALNTLVNGGGNTNAEVRNYDTLFQPLLDAMTTAKSSIDAKLNEYKVAWTTFNTDLGAIIGVGGTSNQDGAITNSEQTAGGENKTDKKKSDADTDSIVGTINAGGEAVVQSFDEVWIPGFETLRDSISDICAQVVACMDEMAKDAIEAAIMTIKAVNAANEASGGKTYEIPEELLNWGGVSYTKPYQSEEKRKKGKAFANGTKGLAHDEKLAVRSEYGQPELTVYPNGIAELTTQPTVTSLPKGTEIFNEEQTKKILNNDNSVLGKAFAKGTNPFIRTDIVVQTPSNLPDYFKPEQERGEDYNLMKALGALNTNVIPPVNAINKNVEMMARNISNVNTNNNQSYSVGDIHIHCSGITSQDVAKEAVTAIEKQLFGMSNRANQRASITR